MIDFTEYIDFFRLFDILTSWWVVKLNDFTEYIVFSTFWFFKLLVGGPNDIFYWIYWIFFDFLTFLPHGGRSKWSNLLSIMEYFDFWTSCWEVKIIDIILNILIFFKFSISCWEVNWAILLDILSFSDDSTFWPLAERSKWLILLTILIFCWLFVFLTSWWEVKMIDFT